MWRELYFAPPMQNLIAYFNSIPIYAGLAVLGYVMRAKTWGKLLLIFGLAALTHMATDLPVHNHDAYCPCIIMMPIAISGRFRIGALSRLSPIMNENIMPDG